MEWNIDPEARASADRLQLDALAIPDTRGLTAGLVPSATRGTYEIRDRESREVHTDMVREVQDLLRDIAFSGALGVMLLLDASHFRARDEADIAPAPDEIPGLFLSEADIAVLLAGAAPPPPSMLATDRHNIIGQGQTVGTWFAGTLLDSSLTKCHGILDRLVAALWCRAELPIPRTRKTGQLMYPVFRADDLDKLETAYGTGPAWPEYRELLKSGLLTELTTFRHGQIHKRRPGSVLNGGLQRIHADLSDATDPQHTAVRGMDALAHVGALLDTYNELVVPAVTLAGTLANGHWERAVASGTT